MKKILIFSLCAFFAQAGYAYDRNGNPTINDAMFAAQRAQNSADRAQESVNRAVIVGCVVIVAAFIVGAQTYASKNNPGQFTIARF